MSFLRRYLKSSSGRTCIIGSTVVVAAHLLPNTIWLDKWQQLWAYRFYGKPKGVVSPPLSEKFQQVLHDLNIPPDVRKLIRIFHVDGFDMFHAGTPNGQFGGILIGVPIHFTFSGVSEFSKKFIAVQQKFLDLERRDAQRLLEMTLLPDAAQKFAMASHLLRVQMGEMYYRAFGAGIIVLLQPVIYEWAKKRFRLEKKTLQTRALALFTTVLSIVYVALLYVDCVSCVIDKAVDIKLAQFGLEYIQGGKEYYQREIGRNLALRSLMEKSGDSYITPEGNYKFYLRYRTLPVTHRRRFFENKLKEYNATFTTV